MFLDLFRGVDFYFFNFGVFQGGFIFLSSLWRIYFIYFSYYFKFNLTKILRKNLIKNFVKKLQTEVVKLKIWFFYLWRFFITITFRKLFGLIPYVYGLTTKIYFVLLFSLWGWFSLIFSSLFSKIYSFVRHFCPRGAPIALGGFLRIIEVVSIGIRPGTLTLRLVAKMTTGHILIGLLTLRRCFLFFSNSIFSLLFLFILLFYVLFEVAICIIQGKVYFMLFKRYSVEHL